jgi:hypothetical protein
VRAGDIYINDWERATELLGDAKAEDREKRAQYGLQLTPQHFLDIVGRLTPLP